MANNSCGFSYCSCDSCFTPNTSFISEFPREHSYFRNSKDLSTYQRIINPDQALLQSIILLLLADIILLVTHRLVPKLQSINIIEFPVGLSFSLVIGWLGYRLVERFFKIYLTEITQNGQKLNSDLLIFAKGLTFFLFLFIIITIFPKLMKLIYLV